MSVNEIVKELRSLSVETGSLACLGCVHEHDCSTKGCAILREAADKIKELNDFQNSELAHTLSRMAVLEKQLAEAGRGTTG